MAPHPFPDPPHSLPDAIDERKRLLRARLRGVPGDLAPDALGALTARLHDTIRGARAIGAFLPFRDEPDLRPLLAALARAGIATGLPWIAAADAPLRYARWGLGDALVGGPFNTVAPAPDAPAFEPDLLLVPGLAFDRSGRRLGRGGGFYDRTLAATAASTRSVGVIAHARLLDAIPVAPFDRPVGAVVTEAGTWRP